MIAKLKEKELVALSISMAAGCRPCTDYHLQEVRRADATAEEIGEARDIAIAVRGRAAEIMAAHAKGEPEPEPYQVAHEHTPLLVAIGAAFAANCTVSLSHYLAAGETVGITTDELRSVAKGATFIRGKAISHVEALAPAPEVAAA